jgi:hypothetical protein
MTKEFDLQLVDSRKEADGRRDADILSLPTYANDGSRFRFLMLYGQNALPAAIVRKILKRLWRKGLFPFTVILVTVSDVGMLLSVDGGEESVAAIRSAIDRIAWGLGTFVSVGGMTAKDYEIAAKLNLGLQDLSYGR